MTMFDLNGGYMIMSDLNGGHMIMSDLNGGYMIMSHLNQGRIQDFKLGRGAHLKKLRRAEGGPKIVGVFRVKNHDFTPKNHIFPILGAGARNFFQL